MKLIFAGKFSGDQDSLPHEEHLPGAVRFKEAENIKVFGIVINVIAGILAIPLLFFVYWHGGGLGWGLMLGCICSLLAVFPHEILHAVCFKETAYIYTNLSQGMLFVVGNETMSKGRFIFMSLLPNIVLGFLPFAIFCLFPQASFLGTFGALSIVMGVGDYYNAFNAATQMPKGAKTYLHKFNSYWYLPESVS